MIVITEFLDEQALKGFDEKSVQYIYDTNLWQDEQKLHSMLGDAVAIVVRNKTQVSQQLLDNAPNLKVVGRLGVGLDNIDMEACKARNVAVCPAIGANAVSVAEYVMASMFILLRGAYGAKHKMLQGEWPRNELMGFELSGKTLGLLGFGTIAREVVTRAKAMGMEIIAYDPFIPSDSELWNGVGNVSFDDCLAQADVVSLHLPFTPETKHIINQDSLAKMKRGSILINSSRGETVDTVALANSLKQNHLMGAALDVFESEPLEKSQASIFADIDNLVLTPHIAGITHEANKRVSFITVENVLKHI